MTGSSSEYLALGAEFPTATREQWLNLVDEVLSGASFESRLVTTTCDGLRIEPLYPRKPHAAPLVGRRGAAPWGIVQRLDHPQAAAANAEAVDDLANGATGLVLELSGAIGSYGYGFEVGREDIGAALEECSARIVLREYLQNFAR